MVDISDIIFWLHSWNFENFSNVHTPLRSSICDSPSMIIVIMKWKVSCGQQLHIEKISFSSWVSLLLCIHFLTSWNFSWSIISVMTYLLISFFCQFFLENLNRCRMNRRNRIEILYSWKYAPYSLDLVVIVSFFSKKMKIKSHGS